MASEALDIVGYCVQNPGATSAVPANQTYLPMLAGSQLIDDPALIPEELSEGLADVIAWTQGVTIPALLLRVPLFGGSASKNWFVASRLQAWLRQTLATGMISANAGVIQHQFADETAREWTVSKVGSFRLDWGGDAPVVATILLMLGGAEQAPTALSSSGSAGQKNTGPYFMSQGVKYASSLSDVVSGSLAINTRQVPDLTTPLAVVPNISTGVSYPNSFLSSGPPIVGLTLTQKKGAATVVEPSDESVSGSIQIAFTDVPGTGTVTFNLYGLKPVRTRPVARGIATITRGFRNIMPSASVRSWDIA